MIILVVIRNKRAMVRHAATWMVVKSMSLTLSVQRWWRYDAVEEAINQLAYTHNG